MPFEVNLSAKFEKDPKLMQAQLEALTDYPYLGSPKYDGIRAYIADGKVLTRKNKMVPNQYIQEMLGQESLSGLDGELIVGKPTDPNVFSNSSSGIMSRGGQPNFMYYVFDAIPGLFPPSIMDNTDTIGFAVRQRALQEHGAVHQGDKIRLVEQVPLKNLKQLLAYEAKCLKAGYEGIMLRKPGAPYKCGRSTLREGGLMAVKRFVDSEAVVLACYEQETNTNEATLDERGKTKRSSAKAGKVGNGVLGGFTVKDVHTGVTFNIGVFENVTTDGRRTMWSDGGKRFKGKIIKYRYQPVGVKDKPRLPVFIGFRDRRDM